VTVRLPRVEAVLGGTVDQLTVDHLAAAVAAAMEEAADLDFKQADYAKGENEELAKDVAAMADAGGGLIVIGIREQDLRAVELTPVPLAGDIDQRYRQVLARRVTPMIRDIEIRVLPAADGPDRGYVLVAVPRSRAAPHAVWEPADDRRRLSFPVRDGANTRYLHETELAEYYRRRFAGTAAQAERLTAVRRQGDARLNRAQLVWLTAALVPGLPGQMRAPDRLDRARS
jgi:predicted HTH transcriptional regulator